MLEKVTSRPATEDVLARTLAEASVEIERLCDEHGATPELIEARQAIESAIAALTDFVEGEAAPSED